MYTLKLAALEFLWEGDFHQLYQLGAALQCLVWGYIGVGGFFMGWTVHHHLSVFLFRSR